MNQTSDLTGNAPKDEKDVVFLLGKMVSYLHDTKNHLAKIEVSIEGGPGKKGLMDRVSDLEHDRTASKARVGVIAVIAGIVGSIATAVAKAWGH